MNDPQTAADKGLVMGVPLPAKTRKERQRARETLEELDCDPFVILAHIALGNAEELGVEEIPLGDRRDAAKELCNYLAPKLKAIEHVDTSKLQGGVMLVPAPVTMDEWQRMVEQSKAKTVEAEVHDG